jgi:hypothetical protein
MRPYVQTPVHQKGKEKKKLQAMKTQPNGFNKSSTKQLRKNNTNVQIFPENVTFPN